MHAFKWHTDLFSSAPSVNLSAWSDLISDSPHDISKLNTSPWWRDEKKWNYQFCSTRPLFRLKFKKILTVLSEEPLTKWPTVPPPSLHYHLHHKLIRSRVMIWLQRNLEPWPELAWCKTICTRFRSTFRTSRFGPGAKERLFELIRWYEKLQWWWENQTTRRDCMSKWWGRKVRVSLKESRITGALVNLENIFSSGKKTLSHAPKEYSEMQAVLLISKNKPVLAAFMDSRS